MDPFPQKYADPRIRIQWKKGKKKSENSTFVKKINKSLENVRGLDPDSHQNKMYPKH